MTSGAGPVLPRDAASLILLRSGAGGREALTGVRGAGARFMPSRRVFPGGALDSADVEMAPWGPTVPAPCARRLRVRCPREERAQAFPLTAIRETWEETGLRLAASSAVPQLPEAAGSSWRRFVAPGARPAAERLRFVFRAVTPRRYRMRFDARFFVADVEAVLGDPDDLAAASGELQDLSWLPLDRLAEMDNLPGVTRRVVREVMARLCDSDAHRAVPFLTDGCHGQAGAID